MIVHHGVQDLWVRSAEPGPVYAAGENDKRANKRVLYYFGVCQRLLEGYVGH